MAFTCQRDSYLKEFETKVTSCQPATLKTVRNGKKTTIQGFDVCFEDTVLFPEGGGQNDDRGTVNLMPVLRVTRKGKDAIHFVETPNPLELGIPVHQVVDWERRFDNMQQHTGQHLVSAVLEQQFLIATTSWWMAENVGDKVGLSYIELDREKIEDDVIREVEEKCNDAIRRHLDVSVRVYENGDNELDKAKTRGLPDDVHGPVRVINIGDMDNNMCCGTHVSNLSHLQVIKLLHTEKGKKGKTNLFFVVGNRVTKYLESCLQREKKLTEILRNGPEDHVDLVEKSVKALKVANKNTQNLLREMAVQFAAELKQQQPRPKYFVLHKKEGDSDFVNTFISELNTEDIFVFLTVGDEKDGPCQITIYGNTELVKELGPKICSVLDAGGGGKGSRMNAKANHLRQRSQAVKLIEEHFSA